MSTPTTFFPCSRRRVEGSLLMRLLTAAHAHARSVASGLSSFRSRDPAFSPSPKEISTQRTQDNQVEPHDQSTKLSGPGYLLTLFMIGRIASRFAPATDALAAASPGARWESGTRIGLCRCLTAFFFCAFPIVNVQASRKSKDQKRIENCE